MLSTAIVSFIGTLLLHAILGQLAKLSKLPAPVRAWCQTYGYALQQQLPAKQEAASIELREDLAKVSKQVSLLALSLETKVFNAVKQGLEKLDKTQETPVLQDAKDVDLAVHKPAAIRSVPPIVGGLMMLLLLASLTISTPACSIFPAPLTPAAIKSDADTIAQIETELKTLVAGLPLSEADRAKADKLFSIADKSCKLLQDVGNCVVDISQVNIGKAIDDGKQALIDAIALYQSIAGNKGTLDDTQRKLFELKARAEAVKS